MFAKGVCVYVLVRLIYSGCGGGNILFLWDTIVQCYDHKKLMYILTVLFDGDFTPRARLGIVLYKSLVGFNPPSSLDVAGIGLLCLFILLSWCWSRTLCWLAWPLVVRCLALTTKHKLQWSEHKKFFA